MQQIENMYKKIIDFLIVFWIGVLVGVFFIKEVKIPADRRMISYEYTTQCRCGGTIEGYQSLVDDYNREECNKCGYHKE